MRNEFYCLLTILFLCQLPSQALQAQQQTFDIVTYKAPVGWKKETKPNLVTYTITDEASKSWCVIGVVRSTISKGNIDRDIESEWKILAVDQYGADSMVPTPTEEADGWQIKSASGQFLTRDKKPAAVLLTTFSGYNRCVSILATTNAQRYLNQIIEFVSMVDLIKPNSVEAVATQPAPIALSKGFVFTTTNFDDGWTATEEKDWVRLTKADLTILIHHFQPDMKGFMNDDEGTAYVWNHWIAPKYKNLSNTWIRKRFWTDGLKYYAESNAVDPNTNQQKFVVLYRGGNGMRWMEFISPDKKSFEAAFTAVVPQEGTQWDRLTAMQNANRFAVAASDIIGSWSSWSGANMQYVNTNTGLDAGMGHAQSGNQLQFFPDGSYEREYKGVSANVGGSNQYYGEKNKGRVMVNNWEVKLTNAFKGETHTFIAWFEAVSGGRVLHLRRGNIEEMDLVKLK